MNHFTGKYKQVTKLEGISFDVSIRHDDGRRWICYAYKENIGWRGFQFTLIDNYLESYSFTWSGPGSNLLVPIDSHAGKIAFDYVNNIVYDGIVNGVICRSQAQDALPLPDFAIDVLQTVQNNALYEVIRRITVAFHEKTRPANNKPNFAHANIY